MSSNVEGRSPVIEERGAGYWVRWVLVVAVIAVLVVAAVKVVGVLTQKHHSLPAGERYVSQAELGTWWPLTVDHGVLACDQKGRLTFTANGTAYALNGPAQSDHSLASITSIVADERPLGRLVQLGMPLCK